MYVKVVVDDMAIGGIIATLKVKYEWKDGMYKVGALDFKSLI